MLISLVIHGALIAFVAYTTLDMALPEGHVEVDFSAPPEGEQIDHQGEVNIAPVPKISKAKKKRSTPPQKVSDKKIKKAKTVKSEPPPEIEKPSQEDVSPVEDAPDHVSNKDIETVEVEKTELAPETKASPIEDLPEKVVNEDIKAVEVEKTEPTPETEITPPEDTSEKVTNEDTKTTEEEKSEPDLETEKFSEDENSPVENLSDKSPNEDIKTAEVEKHPVDETARMETEKPSNDEISPTETDHVSSKDIQMEETEKNPVSANEGIENLVPPQEITVGEETSQNGGSDQGADDMDLATVPITSILPYGVHGGDPNQKAVPITGNPQPRYPFILRWKKVEGVVKTLVTVSPTGRVTNIKVTQSSHDNFTQETLKVLKRWKFQPNGRVYKTTVPFRFKLEGEAKSIDFTDPETSENN